MGETVGIAAAGCVVCVGGESNRVSLIDGKTLDGWIQIENSATSLSSGGITDPAAFAGELANGSEDLYRYAAVDGPQVGIELVARIGELRHVSLG